MISLERQYGPLASDHGVAGTGEFSWAQWQPPFDVLILISVLVVLYVAAWRRYGAGETLPRGRVILFLLGVLTLQLAAATPIHQISEQYLFSAHMVQHLLFTLVAAPLLIAGTPGWMWRPLIRDTVVFRVARVLTHPVAGLLIFNLTIVFTHLPFFVDYTLHNHLAHFFAHVLLMVTAGLMWWPVFSPLKELPRIKIPMQMAYLFAQSLIPAIVASFITFSNTVVYTFYAEAPRLWGLSAIEDQRVAGLVMKLLGSVILWGVMTVRFFQWYNAEQDKPLNLPTWQAAEEELQRMGLTKR